MTSTKKENKQPYSLLEKSLIGSLGLTTLAGANFLSLRKSANPMLANAALAKRVGQDTAIKNHAPELVANYLSSANNFTNNHFAGKKLIGIANRFLNSPNKYYASKTDKFIGKFSFGLEPDEVYGNVQHWTYFAKPPKETTKAWFTESVMAARHQGARSSELKNLVTNRKSFNTYIDSLPDDPKQFIAKLRTSDNKDVNSVLSYMAKSKEGPMFKDWPTKAYLGKTAPLLATGAVTSGLGATYLVDKEIKKRNKSNFVKQAMPVYGARGFYYKSHIREDTNL